MSTVIEPISVAVGDAVRVSGLLQMPSRARLLRAGAWSPEREWIIRSWYKWRGCSR